MSETPIIPVIQQIMDAVVERVESITYEEDYKIEVGKVFRPLRLNREFTPLPNQAIITRDQIEQDESSVDAGGLRMVRTAIVSVWYFLTPDKAEPTPLDQLRDVAIAEIERALSLDWYEQGGRQFYGGLARGAEFLAPEDIESNSGDLPGVRVRMQVRYMHTESDPYTAL